MEHGWHPRRQGDFGELSAMTWLTAAGADVSKPLFHSPYYDLIADFDGTLVRVEVKTSRNWRHGRFIVQVATKGGNQSWNGVVKHLDASRCDYLFVHVADGRRWWIPASVASGRGRLALGGPLYSRFEVEPAGPLPDGGAAVGGGGFEPPKAEPLDLQSNPFDHSGIPPGTPAGDFSGGAADIRGGGAM
jgi:Holliday junction resolvase-like predicted endonuclease